MAEKNSWRDMNRTWLKDVVPLDTPFVVGIETAATCNFKCVYCIHSTVNFGGIMKMSLFKKIINDIKGFPKKLKKLDVFGFGEPLCDPTLADKIAVAKDAGITDNIAFLTNGALFIPSLVDRIISAGVNNIRISLQGLDAETYERVCGYKIDFDKFIENLTYLYENKKQCTVQMKIADIAIKNVEGGREKLQEFFGKISDGVYVEHIFENFMDVDLNAIDPDLKKQNRVGAPISTTPNKVCARQFMALNIFWDGSIVSPCCDPKRSITYGNANVDNLVDVWNCKKRYEFLKFQLEGKRFTRPQCKTCQAPNDVGDQRDVLDSYEDEILARMTPI